MNLATYATKNLFRRRGRTILTIIAVALAVLIFGLIRTVVVAWNAGADAALQDRLVTRHKASITMSLPRRYVDEIRAVPGVRAASEANWFGGKDPRKRVPFFAAFAVDQATWFTVYDDMQLEPGVLETWKATKNGAILGDVLARTFKVKPGDKVTITSDIYPGDWEFEVVGIYKPLRTTVDRNSFIFRWDYLNDDPRLLPGMKDTIGWVTTRIGTASSAEVSRAVDRLFDERDDQTLTMSERAFQLSFLGAFSSVLRAFDLGSLFILLIMSLVLANTVAMSVRERTHEYGVLKALGFRPGHVLGFVMAESALVAVLGGLIGVGLLALVVNLMFGPYLEENMAGMFPYFRTPAIWMLISLALAAGLGALAAALPAVRASRLKVTDALRRLD
jgi:putative ABC transport system permease protein